jgi:hypothetical protein
MASITFIKLSEKNHPKVDLQKNSGLQDIINECQINEDKLKEKK